jgi:N-methylhydantoinase A
MRVAIDTGGTFTDCLYVRNGRIEILKIPSTPENPANAIANALQKIFANASRADSASLDLLCGTTVGTNALLERRGGRVALVTTAGFEDVLEIGRQARPNLYDFFVERSAPLVPRERRFGLRERVSAEGKILVKPSGADFARTLRQVRASSADSVAICFLFSFLRPEHELAFARRLRAAGLSVCVSHEILPEFREFERTSTTVVNAYLVPVMSKYLEEIEQYAAKAVTHGRVKKSKSARSKVRVMQSNGGILSAGAAVREPVRTILSGPAGGVLGAQQVADRAGYPRIISFDMGGTSTDVSLIEGTLRTTNESVVADLPVAVPMLEIHTVGAGGGSIARFDRGGALRVGPESAGAAPGPICYGRGEEPTVTDAHLILGRLGAEGLLGGDFHLDIPRTRRFMQQAIRGNRGIRSVEQYAQGILAVVEATMEKAIRVISIERGRDTREYALVAFGGAGGLHACSLAETLSMPSVLIPKFPGALSALGILCADVVKDFSRTVLFPVKSSAAIVGDLRRAFTKIDREGFSTMRNEGFSRRQLRIERFLDIRYVGQAYELSVPASGDFVSAFHREHELRYGHASPNRTIEIVNVRSRFIGATPNLNWPRHRLGTPDYRSTITGTREVIFNGKRERTPIYIRENLHSGNVVRGPAVIAEYSGTTVVPPSWRGQVDAYENIILSRGGRNAPSV